MRYRDEFNNPYEFLRLANETVPFLNGGLFDCLDEKRSGMYYDGFSERKESMAQLIVPDFLFFGDEAGKNIDLSDFYGDANKKKYCCPVKCVLLPMLLKFFRRNKSNKKG